MKRHVDILLDICCLRDYHVGSALVLTAAVKCKFEKYGFHCSDKALFCTTIRTVSLPNYIIDNNCKCFQDVN